MSRAVTDGTVIVTVDGTDRAAGVGVDISLDSIAVGGTERVVGGVQTAGREWWRLVRQVVRTSR